MNRVFEKILDRLEETRWTTNFDAQCLFENAKLDKCIEIVKEVADEYNNGWIPVSERLPEEPERTDDVEESIRLERLNEYNVMISGAERPTTLYYAGDGYWYDEVSQDYYSVTVWQPLPEPYNPKGE